MRKKVLLLILDGVGVAPASKGNAIALAEPTNLIRLWESNPNTYLEASSEAVGLAPNTNGNSEVGHLTIGAGKINYQNLLKINNTIKKKTFFENQTLKQILYHAQKHNGKIQLMGCLSDGAVHAHIEHFIATLEFFARNNFKGEILFHIFTDGRDVPPKSAITYLNRLEEAIQRFKIGRIASICGRAYAMDRNYVLERTQKAYNLLIFGEGKKYASWQDAIQDAYNQGEIDEYISPSIITQNTIQDSTINDNDVVLFLNFRPDRALQITKAIKGKINSVFKTNNLKNIFFVGMVEYEKNFPEKILFPKEYLALPIGRVISDAGVRQLRIAESEKYAHVTYFMNGGLPIQYAGEDRIKIPSPKVPTFDLKPEMSALEVLNALTSKLNGRSNYQFIVCNLANADMVGHTGNLEAGIKAVKTVDYVVGKIVASARAHDWTILLTADHGNAERMINPENNETLTEHTLNPVPLILIDKNLQGSSKRKLRRGSLSDITPTILKLMGIEKPANMTGRNLNI